MEEELKLQKATIKILSVNTRVDILKLLDQRPMTASEVSRTLNKHVTTISEHLNVLRNSNFVERVERSGHKWVYYKLTKDANDILHPKVYHRWIIVLSLSLLILSGLRIPFVDANPGDPLYGLDKFVENVRLVIASEEGKASLHLEFAGERLKEAKIITEKDNIELTTEILTEYKKEIEDTNVEIDKARKESKEITNLLEEFSESTEKHIATLENIKAKQPKLEDEIESVLEFTIENQRKIKAELKIKESSRGKD